MAFTCALHTYLAVSDVAAARVEGLAGVEFTDSLAGRARSTEGRASVAIEGEARARGAVAPPLLAADGTFET